MKIVRSFILLCAIFGPLFIVVGFDGSNFIEIATMITGIILSQAAVVGYMWITKPQHVSTKQFFLLFFGVI